jgi:hypothetical protein
VIAAPGDPTGEGRRPSDVPGAQLPTA